MSDESSFPEVEISTTDEILGGPEHTFVHVDDVDDKDWGPMSDEPHIYMFEHEVDDIEELHTILDELRLDYIQATGLILPDAFEDEMPLETEVMKALEWCIVLDYEPVPEDIELIREELNDD